ncbi:MAG TPA: tetratricopeptide repeat protein [Kofleriaceae bacterium]|nr:tetratricopeptide repeat protein [Kofleriaceae bacterium]
MVVAALILSSGLVLAQSGEKAAEEWFNKGNVAYDLGRYDEAADNFTKAYEAWQRPEFLYNIAQAYRLGGNCAKALHFYKRFKTLKEKDTLAPLPAKKREEVDRFISELTDCAAKGQSSANVPPDTTDRPPQSPPATTPTPTTIQTAAAPPAEPEEPEQPVDTPARSSNVVPIAVGAGAVVLFGAALGLELWARSTYSDAKAENDPATQESLWHSANTKRYTADGLAVGGAACAGIAVWLFIRNRNNPSEKEVTIAPIGGPGLAGIGIAGSY